MAADGHLTYHSKKPFKDVPHFVNEDGEHLFCRYYEPKTELKGLLLMIHGYAEHCGRYEEVADIANKLGVLMFTHDHRGNGESEGCRSNAFSYKKYVRDLIHHTNIMKEKYPDLPVFLYGHSMGGGIAVFAVHQKPDLFAGMILTGPYITASPDTAKPYKVFAVKVIASVFPSMPVGKLEDDFLTRSPEAIKEYQTDPMVIHSAMTAGTAKEYLLIMNDLRKILPDIKTPYFLAHGEDDKICDIGGSKLLHELSVSEDKTFKVYPGMRHMLEHELKEDTAKFFADVKVWISEHI